MSSSFTAGEDFLREMEGRGLATATFLRLDGDKRGRIIEALLAESARSGPERLNIKEVARLCGLPVGSMYQYFGERENLARFAALLLAGKLSAELRSYIPYMERMGLREALTSYLTYGIEWSEKESASLRAFVAAAYGSAPADSGFGEEGRAGGASSRWYTEALVEPVASAMRETVERVFEAAKARGELRKGIDIDAAARLANVLLIAVGDARMMPSLDAYYQLYDGGSKASAKKRVAQAVDFICRSVMPEARP